MCKGFYLTKPGSNRLWQPLSRAGIHPGESFPAFYKSSQLFLLLNNRPIWSWNKSKCTRMFTISYWPFPVHPHERSSSAGICDVVCHNACWGLFLDLSSVSLKGGGTYLPCLVNSALCSLSPYRSAWRGLLNLICWHSLCAQTSETALVLYSIWLYSRDDRSDQRTVLQPFGKYSFQTFQLSRTQF